MSKKTIAASTMFDRNGVAVTIGALVMIVGRPMRNSFNGKVGYVHKVHFDNGRGKGPEALVYDIPTSQHYTEMRWGAWVPSKEIAIVPKENADAT